MDSVPFANIEYAPAWYHKYFPGFYNIECHNILADYSQHPDKYSTQDKGVEEEKEIRPCVNESNEHVNIRNVKLVTKQKLFENVVFFEHKCMYS